MKYTEEEKKAINDLERKKDEIHSSRKALEAQLRQTNIEIYQIKRRAKHGEILTIDDETYSLDLSEHTPRLWKIRGEWKSKTPKIAYHWDDYRIEKKRETPF